MSAGGWAAADVSAAAFELLETAARLCLKSGVTAETAVNRLEETMFRQALASTCGDVRKAAARLGCDVGYMRRASRMRGYRIFAEDIRREALKSARSEALKSARRRRTPPARDNVVNIQQRRNGGRRD